MSEHTKGRLVIEKSSMFQANDESGKIVASGIESKANARRLVACWNAFEASELSTTQIEDGAFDKMHADRNCTIGERETARADRDELIEALRETSSMLRAAMLIVDDDYTRTTGLERATTNSVLLAKHAPKVPAERCPTCDSPRPRLHPAMQHEGEVQICRDPWHEPKVTA